MVCSAFVLEGLFSIGSAADCASGFVEQERECVCASDDHLPFSGQAVCGLDGNSSELNYITPKTGNESTLVAEPCPVSELNNQQFVNSTINQDELPFTGAELGKYHYSSMNRMRNFSGQGVDSHCTDLAWLWYLLKEIRPLTLLFTVIVIFQPALVSPSMNAFVLSAQLISLRDILSSIQVGRLASSVPVAKWPWPVYNVLAVYGVFNMKLLWIIVPTHCIGSQYNILTVLALQYVTALYPLFLCALLLVPVELYHNNKPLVYICKPVLKCLSRLRNRLNLDLSLPKCLVSLFLLSYVKICSTSILLLVVVPQYDAKGQFDLVLHLDKSVSAFTSQHLPYVVLAMMMLTVFVFAPAALMTLY